MINKTLSSHKLVCDGLEELDDVAETIIKYAQRARVWIFEGDMGAGKTTLIKAICRYFGVEDTVSSPTYAIVNEYRNENDDIFYHFDFYRIQSIEEAEEIGAVEYFDSGEYCFIEWASKVEYLLPEEIFTIHIEVNDKEQRIIELTRYE